MFPPADSDGVREGEILADRVESLAAWIQELDARIAATEIATGDEKTAKELRKAVEAVAKHEPKLEERLTNRVDVLKDRLATLAETVSTTSASLAAKDGEIVGLRRALEAEASRLEALVSDRRTGAGDGELAELRKAVAALSSERSRPRRDRGDRGDRVPGKMEIFEQRLDTLAKTVATTAAELASRDGELVAFRRQLEEDAAGVRAALTEVRAAVDPAPLANLRVTVDELAERTRTLGRRSQQALDGVTAKVNTVTSHVTSLGSTVATTAGGLAASEQELAALRAAYDEETARLDAHVAAIEQALTSITPQLTALERVADRDSVEELAQHVHGISDGLSALSGRFDTVAQTVQETGQGYAEKELELAALARRFDEARGGVEELVAGVRQEMRALAESGRAEEFESRLQELARQTGDISAVRAAFEEESKRLGGSLEEVAQRIDALEEARATAAAEQERVLTASAEERTALAAAARVLEERVQGLTHGLEGLSGRVDDTRAGVERVVSEIRSEMQALAEPRGQEELEGRVHELVQHVESLGARLEALDLAAAGARQEASGVRTELTEELSGLRTVFDEESLRLGGQVGRVEQALASLTPQLAALDRLPEQGAVKELERAVAAAAAAQAELSGSFEQVTQRIDAVERERAAAAADHERAVATSVEERTALAAGARLLEERVQGLAEAFEGLEGRLTAGREQVDTTVGELRDAVSALQAPNPVQAERIDAVSRAVEGQAARVAETERALGSVTADLRSALDALSGRVDGLETGVAAARAGNEQKGVELAALGDRFEQARAKVDALVGDLRQALETMPEPAPDPGLVVRYELLAERVDALAADVASPAAKKETDLLLGKVLLRLDSLEREQEAIASEAKRAARAPGASEDELAELRTLVEGVRVRVTSSEEELAALAGAQDVHSLLDDLGRRLELLERARDVLVPAEPGDGRFRVELRGLELRMDHAEEASRENREAVLTQLERLAARVETRLQALESVPPAASDAAAQRPESSARVVPIRSGEV